MAGLDPSGEVGAERRVALAQLREGVLDALRHREPYAFRGGGELPIPAAETQRGRELAGQEIDLLARPGCAPQVVEPLGLLELLAQRPQPASVGDLRLRVQHRAGVAETAERQVVADDLDGGALDRPTSPDGHQHARLELLAGMTEQVGDVAQTLGVPQTADRPLVGERPVLSFAAEDVPSLCAPVRRGDRPARGRPGPLDLVHLMGARDALQLHIPALAERDVPGALRELLQHRRHEDLPAPGLVGDAGGEDHVLAEEVIRLLDHLPGVEPDAHADRLLGVVRAIACDRPLDRDGAQDRPPRAREDDHEAVALRLHLEAPIGAHLLADDGAVGTQHLLRAGVAEPLGHRRVTLDVGEEDGHRPVGRGVAAQVRLLALDPGDDRVDRGPEIPRCVGALGAQLERDRPLDEALHAELLRGLENGGEEPERLLRVARLPAREQHLRVAELGAGEPWAGADARVHLEPALEVQGRLHPASHCRGEEPEVARDRPAAGDARAHHDVPPRVGQEEVVELGGAAAVPEAGAHLGEHRHGGRPDRVFRQCGEAPGRDRLELAPSVGVAPGLGVEAGEHGAPSRHLGLLLHERGGRGLELREPSLVAARGKELDAEGLHGVLARPLAEFQRLVGELLPFFEAALEERAHRLVEGAMPLIEGLVELVRELRLELHLAEGRPHVAELEQIDDAEVAPAGDLLPVAGGLGQADDLGGDRQALLEPARPPQDRVAGVERVRERRRIAHPTRHRDRLLAERIAALRRARGVEAHGEARHDPRAERAVPGVEGGERLLEERDLVRLVQPEDEARAAVRESRPREQLGRAEPLRPLRRLADGLLRHLDVARPAPGLAEPEEEVDALGLVGRLIGGQQIERGLVLPRALLVGELGERAIGRAPRVRDRLAGVASVLGRLREVVGELRQVPLRLGAMEGLEDLADLAVETHPLRGPELLVERVAHERVREAVAPDRFGNLAHDARRDRLVEQLEQALGRHGRERLDRIEPEIAPERRGDGQNPVAVGRQAVETPPDHLAHALRDADLPARAPLRRLEAPLRHQEVDHLADEEGVPLRLAIDGGDQVRRRREPRGHLDVAGDLALGETAQQEAARDRLARQVAERLEEGMLSAELDVAVRADDEEARAPHLAGEELEEQQRGRVRPVEVVEDEDEGLVGGRVAEERRDAVEEAETRLLGLEGRQRRQVGEPLTHLRDELRDVGRARPHLGADVPRVAVVQVGADDLHPGPVGGCAPRLVAAAPQHLEATQPRVRAELARGARLADAGLAGEQHELPLARARRVDARAQLLELALAADEDAAGEAVERVPLLAPLDHRGGLRGDGRERLAHRASRGRPLLGRLGEHLQDQSLERARHLGVVPGGRDGRGVQVLRDDRHRVVAQEGRPAGHHLVEHRAERVEVAARLGRPAESLLGRHVRDRPHHHALDGETRAVARHGQPEVAELGGAVGGEPHVARLHVAMDDAAVVRVLEGAAHLVGDAERLLDGQTVAVGGLEEVVDRAAGHVLAHDVGLAGLLADVEDRHDVRVVAQLSHRPCLAPDAGEPGLVQPLGLDERDGDVAVEPGVGGEVDSLLPALAEKAAELVAAARDGGRHRGRRRHRGPAASEREPALSTELLTRLARGRAGGARGGEASTAPRAVEPLGAVRLAAGRTGHRPRLDYHTPAPGR